jgi:4-azaleucine resistance transporter AzlC
MLLNKRENNSFKMGLCDGVPIALGYIAVSFAFGIYATGAGLSVIETVMISLLNLTSAGQMAGVPIIAGGGTLIELALTQLVINMRYSLMSVSLSQRFGAGVRLTDRFLIAFTNTDEIFATAISKQSSLGKRYLFALAIAPYFGWAIGTALGAVCGNILPPILMNSLGILLYAMFIAIFVPAAKANTGVALAVSLAIALSAVFYYAPYLSEIPRGFVIMICSVLVSLLFAIAAPIKAEEGENEI